MTYEQEPDINYFETVAVPVLQRKCQELFNSNMVLETNLHMEVTKARRTIEELAKEKSLKISASAEVDALRSELQVAKENLTRLQNVQTEYQSKTCQLEADLNEARNQASSAQNQLTSSSEETQKNLTFLQSELKTSRLQVEALQSELQASKQYANSLQADLASMKLELQAAREQIDKLMSGPVVKASPRQTKVKVAQPDAGHY